MTNLTIIKYHAQPLPSLSACMFGVRHINKRNTNLHFSPIAQMKYRNEYLEFKSLIVILILNSLLNSNISLNHIFKVDCHQAAATFYTDYYLISEHFVGSAAHKILEQ